MHDQARHQPNESGPPKLLFLYLYIPIGFDHPMYSMRASGFCCHPRRNLWSHHGEPRLHPIVLCLWFVSCAQNLAAEIHKQKLAEFCTEILAEGAAASPGPPLHGEKTAGGSRRNWCENRCKNGPKIGEHSEKMPKTKQKKRNCHISAAKCCRIIQ